LQHPGATLAGGAFALSAFLLSLHRQVGDKEYNMFAGGSAAESMEASQVVGLFPSSDGLQIRGAFQKHFVVTDQLSEPDKSVQWVPNNAQITPHAGLRVRFGRPGSGPMKIPGKPAAVTPAKTEKAEAPAVKSEKKSAKKEKKEKKEKKKKKEKA